jgi:hypothetical protein
MLKTPCIPETPKPQNPDAPQELVQDEFADVYGQASLAVIMPACYTRGLVAALNAYNSAKTALEVRRDGGGLDA